MLRLRMSHAFRISLLALLALALAILTACSNSAPPPGLSIQPSWQRARLSHGHQIHVMREHVPCSKCHDMSGSSVGTPAPARCADCHRKEGAITHAQAQAAQRFGTGVKADCTSCHAFSGVEPSRVMDAGAPAWAQAALDSGVEDAAASDGGVPGEADGGIKHGDFGARDCVRCHAAKQGATPAITVHASARCVSCHRPHDDAKPKPGECSACHQNISTVHAAQGKSTIQVCTTCHEHQHGKASEAIATCAECHAKATAAPGIAPSTQAPIIPASALFASGHSQCINCHKPHEFQKSAALSCRSCHAQVHVLGESSVLAHNQCTSCHSPHDVRGTPEQACQGCHANVHPDHPKTGGVHACTGCHEPHPAAGHLLETALKCSSCHQQAHSDKDFHHDLACTQCHAPHAFALKQAGQTLCSNCHAQELARVALRTGHQRCNNCHGGLPHHPETGLAACGSCHAKQLSQVKTGHAKCTQCHEPHSGAQGSACRTCHQKEANSAPSGHAQCTTCHEPHTGSVTAAPACASCHVTEGNSKHGAVPGGCSNCHQPHQGASGPPSAPACTTCHQTANLLGLHQVAKHQDCKRCHTGHGDQPSLLRDACLTCHADRKAHFPDAPRCANCHLFETRK